jgi:hypothetical protein
LPGVFGKSICQEFAMSVDQISSPPRRSKISLNATALIALAVMGFVILHFIGGTLLQRQSPSVPSIEGSTSAIDGD